MKRTCRRPVGLAVLAVATAAGLAACSGGSSPAPSVASLPASSSSGTGGSSPSTAAAGSGDSSGGDPSSSATQLLNEWAACMRSHGDPSQTDPTIDANKVIHVVMPLSVPGGLYGSNGQSSSGPGSYCGKYLTAASTALRGGQQAPTPPSQAELVKYADCMRANGISNFPDPIAGGFNLRALNPDSPALQNAAKVCATKTGVRPVGGGGPLPPGTIVSGPPGEAGMPFVPLSGSSS